MGNGSSNCSEKNQGERIDELRDQINNAVARSKQNLAASRANVDNYARLLDLLAKEKADVTIVQTKYDTDYKTYNTNIASKDTLITTRTKDLNTLTNEIIELYGAIGNSILVNDVLTDKINANKKSILEKSYSISFFENLLLAAYAQIFSAVNAQNNAIDNNYGTRADMYSTDNSTYVYQQNRISFYKNLNTGLFYTYYVLIILLIYVILRLNQNTSILVKLTLFRVFVVILILFPLVGLVYQRFIYKLFHYFYDRISVSGILNVSRPPGTSYSPPKTPDETRE